MVTNYPHINEILDWLLSQMQSILGDKLVGLYLYGSLASGDFDDSVSDIDLLAALADDLTDEDFAQLDAVHNQLVHNHPERQDRIEIAYLSRHGLHTFKTQASPIGIISPGEPFHIIQAGHDWSVNWYMVREIGVTLFGPPPTDIIEPISQTEFVQVIRWHMAAWREWITDIERRPAQAYAIITMCRGLYTIRNGKQVSKLQAAVWANTQLPEWASLIDKALAWRLAWNDPTINIPASPDETAETRRFVNTMIDLALSD